MTISQRGNADGKEEEPFDAPESFRDGAEEKQRRQWHRLFGLTLTDYFTGSPYDVELEKDLSLKRQYLDMLIISRKSGAGKPVSEKIGSETDRKAEPLDLPCDLPDGLESLGEHNLLTYKSHRESMDAFAVNELIGHYANYCKQVSQSFGSRLPEECFRLYAVSARFPEKLSNRVPFERTPQPGIYDVKWGVFVIRFIVLSRISEIGKNAPWLMFSADADKVGYGAKRYSWKTQTSAIMNQLFEKYKIEGVPMPYTMDDFLKENKEEVLNSLTQNDINRILKGLKPEEVFRRYKPEDRLKGLKPEEVFNRFKPEDRLKGLNAEDRLKAFQLATASTKLQIT